MMMIQTGTLKCTFAMPRGQAPCCCHGLQERVRKGKTRTSLLPSQRCRLLILATVLLLCRTKVLGEDSNGGGNPRHRRTVTPKLVIPNDSEPLTLQYTTTLASQNRTTFLTTALPTRVAAEERRQQQQDVSPLLVPWKEQTPPSTTAGTPGRHNDKASVWIRDEPHRVLTMSRHNSDNDQEETAETIRPGIVRHRWQRLRKFLGPHGPRQAAAADDDDKDALPIAYRYYGRKFHRPPSAGSIPMILLGPNADHWKVTGQQLQQQGFSVLACEPVKDEHHDPATASPDPEELVQIVLNLLDALRWQNALLVACDEESLGAIQLALRLAPERIAGLVLCGNLQQPNQFAALKGSSGFYGLDAFLEQNLNCPFLIVWNGDTSEGEGKASGDGETVGLDVDASSLLPHRSLILGGGTAPHRRRPEQLAWVITRFVEEHLAQPVIPRVPRPVSTQPQQNEEKEAHHQQQQQQQNNRIELPLGLEAIFSQEFFVVMGRLFATGIAYGIVLKVGLYQYKSFQSGIFDFQTRLQDIMHAPGRLLTAIIGVFRWIPRTMGMVFGAREQDINEDHDSVEDVGGSQDETVEPNTNETETPQEEEEDEVESEDTPLTDDDRINYGPLFFLDKVIV